jgi:type IV secretory pathway VirB2 component (pilin)
MMIVEGVIAMIWAAAAMSLMNGEDLSVLLQMKDFRIVHKIATVFLGTIGGTVAVLGVIVLPITSGTPPLERQE